MVTQPHGAKPDGEDARRTENARLLGELVASQETQLRRQAECHSRLAADAEDALHDAYALFLDRYHGRFPALPYLMASGSCRSPYSYLLGPILLADQSSWKGDSMP